MKVKTKFGGYSIVASGKKDDPIFDYVGKVEIINKKEDFFEIIQDFLQENVFGRSEYEELCDRFNMHCVLSRNVDLACLSDINNNYEEIIDQQVAEYRGW